MAAGSCRGRPRAGPGRRVGLRHRGQLADLEPDRRQGPCDRRHKRRADAALRHRREPLGRGNLRPAGHPHGAAARGARLRGRLRHDAARPVRRRHPDPGRRGRPAGRDRGAGLFPARHDEIDLWHGLFRAAEHRGGTRRLAEPAADHDRLSAGGTDDLCAGRLDLCRGRGGAMAARRAEDHPPGGRDPAPGRGRRSGPAGGDGPRLHRAWRALLAARVPGRDLWPDAQFGTCGTGAGGAGKRGLPDPRPVAGDAGRLARCGRCGAAR